MASEVPREREYGRFKPARSVRIKAKARKPAEKREARPGNSEAHLAAIRKCPCAACGRVPAATVHHLKSAGDRGMGQRAPDRLGVPLCMPHHEEIERAGTRNEFATFERWGIADVYELAAALWSASADIPKMTRIVIAHRRGSK